MLQASAAQAPFAFVLAVGHALLGALLLCSGPPPSADKAPPEPVSESAAQQDEVEHQHAIAALVVRLDGLDHPTFLAAMRLRAPGLSLHEAGRDEFEPPAGSLYAYALVHPVQGQADHWSVTVIVSDGRAFFRTLEVTEGEANRVVSTTVANLLRAAEARAIEPDANRSMPRLDASPEPEPTPALAIPSPVAPTPEIGLTAHGALVLGFGPPTDVDVLAGGGGGIGLDVRLPGGAVFGLEGRGLGRTRRSHRLSRVRVAISGGYSYRRGAFEMVATGFVAAEPWFVSSAGKIADPEVVGGPDPTRVLLGGGARLGPGYLVSVGRRTRLHLGLRAEVGGSGMPSGGVGRLAITRDDGTQEPVLRLGGFEVGAGVELTWWIATSGAR